MADKVRTVNMQFDREHKGTVRFKATGVDDPVKTLYLERNSLEAQGIDKWEGKEALLTLEVK